MAFDERSYRREYYRAYYRRRHAELIAFLGGVCVQCGATENLQVDHIDSRTWDIRKCNRHTRIARYWREAMQGLVQVLCKSCNSSKGDPTSFGFSLADETGWW